MVLILKEIFCCNYSLDFFSPPTYISHTAHTHLSTKQLILENKFATLTDVYTENNMLNPEFMSGLVWNYRVEKVNYHFKYDDWLFPCFPFEKRANHLTICKNILLENLFIAVYDL